MISITAKQFHTAVRTLSQNRHKHDTVLCESLELEQLIENLRNTDAFQNVEFSPALRKEIDKLIVASQRSIKEIAETAAISQRSLAERFGIPYRTVENWRFVECPIYLRLLIQEQLGMYHNPVFTEKD